MPTDLRSTAGETLEFEVGPVERDNPSAEIFSSTGAVIDTVLSHSYAAGDHVRVDGHVWNPVNGRWVIASVQSATRFTLSGVSSNVVGGQTGWVTKVVPVDLTLANTVVWFSAKRHLSDPDVLSFLVKGNVAPLYGVTLNQPSSTRKNLATVTIPAQDTAGVLDSEDFYFDVQLQEPGGRVTRLDHGIWKVEASVTRL